ncbi:caa2d7a2-0254-45e2-a604-3754b9675e7c [Sclerotinia trifoliorum]|uniref:Caa2d7a2-0254-45e2-a604-3754b9675e7c n=1 Tax=Sclerotinia trifoliorum TaxID=28548 RepID=A0A8H2ZSN8_9HELO|nr:caa2d7a2-0254-45e2-a604-3754b9675e7c [Sclerotinia trifoliorum]
MSTISNDDASQEENQSMIALHDYTDDERHVNNIRPYPNLFNDVPIASFPQEEWYTDVDSPMSYKDYQKSSKRSVDTILCHTRTHFDTSGQVPDHPHPTIIPDARDLYNPESPSLMVASPPSDHSDNLHLTISYTTMVQDHHVADRHKNGILDIPSHETVSSGSVESLQPINSGTVPEYNIHIQSWSAPDAIGDNKASIAATPSSLGNSPSPCQGERTFYAPGGNSYKLQYSTPGPSTSPYDYPGSQTLSFSTTASTMHTIVTGQFLPNMSIHTPPETLLFHSPHIHYTSDQTQLHCWISQTSDDNMPPAERFEKSKWAC